MPSAGPLGSICVTCLLAWVSPIWQNGYRPCGSMGNPFGGMGVTTLVALVSRHAADRLVQSVIVRWCRLKTGLLFVLGSSHNRAA